MKYRLSKLQFWCDYFSSTNVPGKGGQNLDIVKKWCRNGMACRLHGFKSNRKCLADHKRSCGKNSARKFHRLKSYNHGSVDGLGT